MAKFHLKSGPGHHNQTQIQINSKPPRHAFRANLVERPEMVEKRKELCWMVHTKFYDILFGDISQYTVNSILDV